ALGLHFARVTVGGRRSRLREDQSDRRPDARHRLDLRLTAMTLHDAVHFGQAEARARRALRGEEGLERTLAHFRRHADTRIAHFESNLAVGDDGAQTERAAPGHGIERVLDEVEQRLADLSRNAAHDGAVGEVTVELNRAAARALGPQR